MTGIGVTGCPRWHTLGAEQTADPSVFFLLIYFVFNAAATAGQRWHRLYRYGPVCTDMVGAGGGCLSLLSLGLVSMGVLTPWETKYTLSFLAVVLWISTEI